MLGCAWRLWDLSPGTAGASYYYTGDESEAPESAVIRPDTNSRIRRTVGLTVRIEASPAKDLRRKKSSGVGQLPRSTAKVTGVKRSQAKPKAAKATRSPVAA